MDEPDPPKNTTDRQARFPGLGNSTPFGGNMTLSTGFNQLLKFQSRLSRNESDVNVMKCKTVKINSKKWWTFMKQERP